MDFKTLIGKIDSIEQIGKKSEIQNLQAKPIQLNEDAQLRVLAGTTTLKHETELMEKKLTTAEKKKKEEVVKSMKKDKKGFSDRYGKRGKDVMYSTATKIAKKKAESVEEETLPLDEAEKLPAAKKNIKCDKSKKHGLNKKSVKKDAKVDENFYSKFQAMVNANLEETAKLASDDEPAKPKSKVAKKKTIKEAVSVDIGKLNNIINKLDQEDIDCGEFKTLVKKLQHAASELPNKVSVRTKGSYSSSGMPAEKTLSRYEKQRLSSRDDYLDSLYDSSNQFRESPEYVAQPDVDKKEQRYFDSVGDKINKTESGRSKKKMMKESYEQTLTFKQLIQLVRESGGQQQIDPVDSTLWNWAQRVASNKFNESTKQEIYAGLIYERMGGSFQLYDVLNENQ